MDEKKGGGVGENKEDEIALPELRFAQLFFATDGTDEHRFFSKLLIKFKDVECSKE